MPPSPAASATYRIADRDDLERIAAEFAAMDVFVAEALIASFAAQSIALWRLDDATAWQRVKFRARLIRATRPKAPAAGEGADDRPGAHVREN